MKYPYGRKSKKWFGEKAPTTSERRAIEKELLAHAEEEEHKSKEQAAFIRIHGKTRVIKGQGHIVNNYRSLCSLIGIHSVKLGEGMLPQVSDKDARSPLMRASAFSG